MVEGGRVYIPALYVVNKIDQISLEELEVMDRLVSFWCFCIFRGALQNRTRRKNRRRLLPDKQQHQKNPKRQQKQPHYVPVCAYLEWNLDGLVEMIWEYLDLLRVYTKPKGRLPDFGDPVVLRRDKATVEDFANRIHKG